jgi:hypothetical protein
MSPLRRRKPEFNINDLNWMTHLKLELFITIFLSPPARQMEAATALSGGDGRREEQKERDESTNKDNSQTACLN